MPNPSLLIKSERQNGSGSDRQATVGMMVFGAEADIGKQ